MNNFPSQKLQTNRKDKQWRVDCVDFIINESNYERFDDLQRMTAAYRLVNSQLDQEDYRSICQNLGVDENTGKKYVEAYNKAHNVYSTLKGEESARPFNFNIVNLSPDAMNQVLLEEELEYRKYLDSIFQKEFEMISKEIELELKIKSQEIDPNQQERQMDVFRQELEKKYAKILDIDKIKARTQTKLTEKENTISKLLRMSIYKDKIKWLKNETFGDAVIAGKELVEIAFIRDDKLPRVRQLNPLNVFYHKSPDNPFIHLSDYAGYKEHMTIGQVLDLYGDKMSNKDVDNLRVFAYDGSGSYGTSDTMFHTRDKVKADSWSAKTASRMYPSGPELDPYGAMIAEGKVQGIPQNGGSTGGNIIGPGLYADNSTQRKDYVSVYTVYWKSFRKVGKYTFTDEYGRLKEEVVDEDFVIPTNAKTERDSTDLFAKPKVKRVWYDENSGYNSFEESWISEVWKGKRINSNMYFEIEPLEHAYQSLLSPYESKLPIFGYVHNSRNATTVSTMDRIMPWQKLYYVVMSKLLKMITQDKGILTFLNTLMIDKNFGLKRTLQMAEDQGLIPYNPLSYSKGGAFVNTFKVAERVDATNSQTIDHYINLLHFVESNLEEAVGMSPQRLAQATPNKTATDNQRQTAHSMNITESLFSGHEVLWEDIMQGYMEMMISSLNGATGKIRGFLNDEEIAVLDLGNVSLEDEYLLKFSNNSKNHRILEQGYGLAHALIQNDKANLSTLINLMQTDDLNQFKKELLTIEDDIAKREEKMQQNQQASQEEQLKREALLREDLQKARLDEIYLKGKLDEAREHVKGKYMITSFNMKEDADNSGEMDLIQKQTEYERFLHEIAKNKTEAELRSQELEQRKLEHADEIATKNQHKMADASDKELDRQSDARMKMTELATKERIEKAKANSKTT